MAIKIDPEFKNLIPPLEEDEFKQLERNIKRYGCRDPLTVWDEPNGDRILLDGHNRYQICQMHDIAYTIKAIEVPDRMAARIWVIENQFGRRNLPLAARAKLALQLQREIKKRTQIRSPASADRMTGERSKDVASDAAQVSPRTMDDYKRISRDADPSLLALVDAGRVSISAAIQLVRLPKDRQNTLAMTGPAACAREAMRVKKMGVGLNVHTNDREGHPLTTQALTTFLNASHIDTIVNATTTIRRTMLKAIMPDTGVIAGGEIASERSTEILGLSDRLSEVARYCRPWSICYCDGKDKKCPSCYGRGWVNRETFNAFTTEQKATLDKLEDSNGQDNRSGLRGDSFDDEEQNDGGVVNGDTDDLEAALPTADGDASFQEDSPVRQP